VIRVRNRNVRWAIAVALALLDLLIFALWN